MWCIILNLCSVGTEYPENNCPVSHVKMNLNINFEDLDLKQFNELICNTSL